MWVAGCGGKDIALGEQCPSPFSGRATVIGDARLASGFGTGCAPCGNEVRLDSDGCPIYYAPGACAGGNLCLFGLELVEFPADEDAGRPDASDDDAGATDGGQDGAGPEDDGGAR